MATEQTGDGVGGRILTQYLFLVFDIWIMRTHRLLKKKIKLKKKNAVHFYLEGHQRLHHHHKIGQLGLRLVQWQIFTSSGWQLKA